MEILKLILINVILVIIVLVRVAFVTLIEQKILSGFQIRVGPNKVGYWGILQPFRDAVKLFIKENIVLQEVNIRVYVISPILGLSLILIIWIVFPFFWGRLDFYLGLLFFICVRGLAVYPILMIGWASNCKYSLLGRLRALAQIISYEVRLGIILLRVIWIRGSFRLKEVLLENKLRWGVFFYIPLSYIWFVSRLAETNRSPYDFAEGESELVSGFNTEYRAGGFVLVFIAEYGRIIFIRFLFTFLFLRSNISIRVVLKRIILSCWFIWVRGTVPRYRYDKLINLAWKRFLPNRLFLFIYYLFLGWIIYFLYFISLFKILYCGYKENY